MGIFATHDFEGAYDNFEVVSITRLERIPEAEGTHSLSLRYKDKERQLYQFQFLASKYIDFFDHMNSWDRNVWVSPQQSSWAADLFDLSQQPQKVQGLDKWKAKDEEMRQLMSKLIADEDYLVLGGLTEADVQDRTEADVQNTKKALKNVRYKLDQYFRTIAEALGFDVVTPPQRFEIILSNERYALFIQSPEPIDWTRISATQIRRNTPDEGFDTEIIYSSDMTRSIVLIKDGGNYTTFSGERYTWNLELDTYIPNYLDWLKPWLEANKETYEITFEMRAQ